MRHQGARKVPRFLQHNLNGSRRRRAPIEALERVPRTSYTIRTTALRAANTRERRCWRRRRCAPGAGRQRAARPGHPEIATWHTETERAKRPKPHPRRRSWSPLPVRREGAGRLFLCAARDDPGVPSYRPVYRNRNLAYAERATRRLKTRGGADHLSSALLGTTP